MTAHRLRKIVLLTLLCAALVCSHAAAESVESALSLHPHTDPYTGVTFQVPDGWTEETFSQNGYKGFDTYTRYEGPNTRHGHYLIFMHIISDEFTVRGHRRFDTRAEYDAYANSLDHMAQAALLGRATLVPVEFNGVTYYMYDAGDSVWQYFIAHNGYLHMFQFDTGRSDPNYAWFQAIMNSVVFPDPE